ncbi:MAG TPA: hypothetical protein VH459_09475 [Gaiellales bacterium]
MSITEAVAFEDGSPFTGAIVGAAAGAALGAAGWAAMVVATNHSFGFAALGLGFLSTALVSRFGGGRRGIAYVALAMASVVVALAVGKYVAFAYLIHRDAQRELGSAGAAYFGYLSTHTWHAFTRHLSDEFSPFYLLWVGLAGSVAWRRLGPASAV